MKKIWNNIISRQLKKPSGLLAGYVGKRFEQNNVKTNDWILSLLDVKPSDRVLEIGYGPGYAMERILRVLKQGGLYAGVDFSRSMYRMAKKRSDNKIRQGLAELHCCDCLNIPYPDRSFNKVFAINVAYFWDEPVVNLMEIKRVLQEGGAAYIYLTEKGSLEKIRVANTRVFRKYTKDDFLDLMAKSGFTDIKVDVEKIEHRGRLFTSLCFVAKAV